MFSYDIKHQTNFHMLFSCPTSVFFEEMFPRLAVDAEMLWCETMCIKYRKMHQFLF